MRYLSLCVLLVAATTAAAQTPSGKGPNKVMREPITLTGCVAAGAEKNAYMLSNIMRTDASGGNPQPAEPGAIYWFNQSSKLKAHVGHQVAITGVLDDDVKTTKVKEKDGKVELKKGSKKVEVSEGTTAGNAAGTPGTTKPSYKVEVQSVKMLSPTCSK